MTIKDNRRNLHHDLVMARTEPDNMLSKGPDLERYQDGGMRLGTKNKANLELTVNFSRVRPAWPR